MQFLLQLAYSCHTNHTGLVLVLLVTHTGETAAVPKPFWKSSAQARWDSVGNLRKEKTQETRIVLAVSLACCDCGEPGR